MGPETRVGRNLLPVTVALVVVVVGVLVGGTDGQQLDPCNTKFSDVGPADTSLECTANCVTLENLKKHPVIGTNYYNQESYVCAAATHAGVLGSEGGQVSFTKINNHSNITRGTIRNRVVSSKDSSGSPEKFQFLATEEVIKTGDLVGDVIVVHNSYSGNTLHLSCLVDSDTRTLSESDLLGWNYGPLTTITPRIIEEIYAENGKQCIFPITSASKKYYGCFSRSFGGASWCYTDYGSEYSDCISTTGKAVIATVSVNQRNNARAFRCLGVSPATDVLAIIKRTDQLYTSPASTVKTNLGDNLTVTITRKGKHPSTVFFRRLPDPWPYNDDSDPDTDLTLTFDPVSLEDDGIYIVGNYYSNRNFKAVISSVNAYGEFFHLLVQKCPVGRYGIGCNDWCPDCENGGVCHAATGSCVCPPGFKGPTCQEACTYGSFGHNCQLWCERKYLGFDPPGEKCEGLTFCVPEPYGCSCAPGYHGPYCNQDCEPGQYGAGCSLRCDYCEGQNCNRYSGKCTDRCLGDVTCLDNKPLDLPRLRVPPTISDVKDISALLTFSAWDPDSDDGSNAFPVTGYAVELMGEGDEWQEVWTSDTSGTSKQASLTALQAGRKYSVRALVKTDIGTEDGTTNKRVHIIPFTTPCEGSQDVSDLTASRITNTSVVFNWNVRNRHERCGEVTYSWKVETGGMIVKESPTQKNSLTLNDLKPGTGYSFTVTASSGHRVEEYIYTNANESTSGVVLRLVLPMLFLILAVFIIAGLVLYYKRRHPKKFADLTTRFEQYKVEFSNNANTFLHDLRPTPSPSSTTTTTTRPAPSPSPLPPPSPSAPLTAHYTPTTQDPAKPQHQERLPAVQTPAVVLPSLAFQPSPATATQNPPQADAIYENFHPQQEEEENIYENLSINPRIPLAQLEAYLHKMIGSQELLQEFESVAPNVGKSMSDGELPYNKRKNRYRNNLPYNDTRVRLLVTSHDPPPGADYINANHVRSYGGLVNYIAAQAPKDQNDPTLGSFWHMVLEQQVTTIIMVANFVEGDKVKVGEYLRYGESITVEDMTVQVVDTTSHLYYNTSIVQVWRGDNCYTVTHYHYTAWPDHGVPTEAHTLAAMLRHFLQAYDHGAVVVHCSAGIGRTGTVLMVLLLNDMLQVHGSVAPLEVLQYLRECRARLVENVLQFNLGFQIFDELEYGMSTSIPSESLCDQLEDQLEKTEDLFQRLSALPSNLTFRAASQAEFTHLNRDSQILPADTRGEVLEMIHENPLTQYINAVRLDSLNQPNKMLATEHPLPGMLEQFWRLVVLKHCPSIVLLNTYDGYEMDFPCVIPEVNKEMTVGSLMVQTQDLQQDNSLLTYTVQVYPLQDPENVWTVTVYQITCWSCVEEEPSNLQVLLNVALTLHHGEQYHQPGPILLSCKDGVRGCGIMAGVIILLERLNMYQTVDVYRTAVLLRRARPQFFTDHNQLSLLYRIAALHLTQQYGTYANI